MQRDAIHLPILGEPEAGERGRAAPPWLRIGFRPFFLAAALYAVVALSWWLHQFRAPPAPQPGAWLPMWWHAHEMLFGFTLAVVAGFLLTAVRNWTGRRTARGGALAALLALWVAGRAGMAAQAWLPAWATGALAVSFPVALVFAIARPVFAVRQRNNYGIVAALALLAACDAGSHLYFGAGDASGGRRMLLGALHLIVLLNVVVGGRVIGMFTWAATGRGGARRIPAVEAAAIGGSAALALAVASGADARLLAALAVVAGSANLLRMRAWLAASALRVPMLLVLHAGYAWIGIGQLLLAGSWSGLRVVESTALHALTIGVLGTMTLGMMARVSLGHTGRPIEASRATTAAFLLMLASPLARLAALLLPASAHAATVYLSGALFAAAFLVFVAVFSRILLSPRPDGRED